MLNIIGKMIPCSDLKRGMLIMEKVGTDPDSVWIKMEVTSDLIDNGNGFFKASVKIIDAPLDKKACIGKDFEVGFSTLRMEQQPVFWEVIKNDR